MTPKAGWVWDGAASFDCLFIIVMRTVDDAIDETMLRDALGRVATAVQRGMGVGTSLCWEHAAVEEGSEGVDDGEPGRMR